MPKTKVSLVLPCYNEAEHFKESSIFILNTLKKSHYPFEIIFVEDKSQDNTAYLIKEFIKTHKTEQLKVIYLSKNMGRGNAVTKGIISSQGKFVGFMDIDCEVSPKYIPQFIEKLNQGYDVVCGKRLYQISVTGFIRALVSKIYSLIMKILLGTKLEDTEAGYKFFKKDKIAPVLNNVFDQGWFWDTEFMVRAEKQDLKIVFLPVVFDRRTDKTSTVNLWSDSIDYIKKLIVFKKQLWSEDHEK